MIDSTKLKSEEISGKSCHLGPLFLVRDGTGCFCEILWTYTREQFIYDNLKEVRLHVIVETHMTHCPVEWLGYNLFIQAATSPGTSSQPLSRPSLTKGSCPSLHSSLVRHAHNGSTSTICGSLILQNPASHTTPDGDMPPLSTLLEHHPGAPPPASRLPLRPWGGPAALDL